MFGTFQAWLYMKSKLPIIVLSQFFCTSVWFAANAVFPDLIVSRNLPAYLLADLTSAIQLGFITGTLSFAILTIADRYSPSKVFFVSALLAACFNLSMLPAQMPVAGILFCRFLTGFFLAGIYPVGMKIAADYYEKGLGKSLGFLVGALVLGKAFPHFLKSMTASFSWEWVIYGTSALSVLGGLAILLGVPDGPFRKKGQRLDPRAFLEGFKNKHFKAAAFGYFGHMWELYTFWALVPVMLKSYKDHFQLASLDISFFSFLIIAAGSFSCALGGLLSNRYSSRKIATTSLALSGLCCLVSPFFLLVPSFPVLIIFLFFWGLMVVADSPQFSTLIAMNAPVAYKGTALTIVNCIGFSITIVSLQCLEWLSSYVASPYLYVFLGVGPLWGLWQLALDYRAGVRKERMA